MSRKLLKGIKQVAESGLSAETGFLYLIEKEDGKGYVQLDGKKYGEGSEELWERGTGENSIQQKGTGAIASGNNSVAEGSGTTASGLCSHAEGESTTASGVCSHAEGSYTTASGWASHAEGQSTTASGNYSHAEGFNTTASGQSSHAEGQNTTASDKYSHAEGSGTTASGWASHAEGWGTTASGGYSHAEGWGTSALTENSHAEGYNTRALGDGSHAEGDGTTASGYTSHAEGRGTTASGDNSHAEGSGTTASGEYSHAEGERTTAEGRSSHAEGYSTTASGRSSHAEGHSTTASGPRSHAEGYSTTASGICSHAEGSNTTASGGYSHAEGSNTTASGGYSHAEGESTIASGSCSHAEGSETTSLGNYSHAEGERTTAEGRASHAEGGYTTASGDYSHAEGGNYTTALGNYSHAEGGSYTTASGDYSHAEGYGTTASGRASHAENRYTAASGYYSHAEGDSTIASGQASHAEGRYNAASNDAIHMIGIGDSAQRKNAFEVWYNGNVFVYGLNGYNGYNASQSNSLQNLFQHLKIDLYENISYSNLVSKTAAGNLEIGKTYIITDYQTTSAQSGITATNNNMKIIVRAIDKNKLDESATAYIPEIIPAASFDRYIWIDNFPDYILENEPELLSDFHLRGHYAGISKRYKYISEMSWEGETYHLWKIDDGNLGSGISSPGAADIGFADDENNRYPYILTYSNDYAGQTLVDDVNNHTAPIYAVLNEDLDTATDYPDMGERHELAVEWVVEQEDYRYDPYTVRSNVIFVEKFANSSVDFDFYHEDAPNDPDIADYATEYHLTGTITFDDEQFYMWQAIDGQHGDVPHYYPQYSYMLTRTASFVGLSLEENVNSRFCPVYCFLDEDMETAYSDESGYKTHEMLLISARFDSSLPTVAPLPGTSGESSPAEVYEIKYSVENNEDKFAWADSTNGKGVIYYMKDAYGNEAPFDFRNILQPDGEFTFGDDGENYALNGFENGVYGNKILPRIVSGVQYINEIRFEGTDTYANTVQPSANNITLGSTKESTIGKNSRGTLVVFNPAEWFFN